MTNLKEAASLINELSQNTQLELYKSWQHNQDATVSRLVDMAKEKGQAGYDAATVKRLIEEFIAEVQKNDENEDLELKEEELTAVAGGNVQKSEQQTHECINLILSGDPELKAILREAGTEGDRIL